MDFPQKIKNGTALGPSVPTSGYISKETQNTNLKKYMYPYVPCGIIYNSQAVEAAQVPINRQVDKITGVHICERILLSPPGAPSPVCVCVRIVPQ